MKRFCKECGKEAQPNHNVCIHCGTPLEKIEANQSGLTRETRTNKKQAPKKPMSKAKKILWGVVAGLVALLIGAHMWTDNYLSYESVEERFEAALSENDSKKLANLIVHEDGSSISEQEAKAFAKLKKSESKRVINDLYEISFNGKFLGIYDTYKIEVVDQFAYYDDQVDGLTFKFNNKEIPEFERDKESTTYGPLAPGVYTVEATFKGDYGETSSEETVTLAYKDRSYTQIGEDLPIAKVTFHVENYEQFDVEKAHILLNKEEIAISKDGESEEIGPFILDGSQTVKTVVTMPWGEVVSEEIPVDDENMSLNASLITPEQYKGVTATLKDFGEQYVTARAEQSTKPLKVADADVKKEIGNEFNDFYHYSGKLEKVQIDRDSLTVNTDSKTPEISIDAKFIVKEDEHEATESPNLYEMDYTWNIGLTFDEKADKWTVISKESISGWGSFEDADEVAGSKKLHGPSEEAVEAAKTKELEDEIELFMAEYTSASVDAINYRDFSIMESYLTDDGPRKKEARDYIDYLDSKGIYEDWYGTDLEKLEKVDDTTYKVTVIDEFNIIKPDSSSVKKFRTILHLKDIDGAYYVDELLETKEI